jgi:hypothetical protein
MKVLKIALLVLLVLVVLFVGIGLFLPDQWNVERSILIQAPPEAIHDWVDRPSRWNDWFAWEEMTKDPAYKVTTNGPERGVGASYAWTSDSSNGKLVIKSSDPKTGIYLDESIESDEVNAQGAIVYTPAEGGATRVTWTDTGKLPPVIGGWFRGMLESTLGEHFGKGLANLKAKVEAEQKR